MSAVIHVESLGKRYRIGEMRGRGTLRDRLSNLLSAPTRLLTGNGNHKKNREEIWALRDINFEIQQGEVVGLIGRNGAGKSTLLKVLSRVTQPTTGWAEVRGRMGSLLEVGTGFHPELTGRENVFLNGAILGMRKREITRKFDEIVAFSEVEQFIDTPVKHYSSGMYVRLAFAVAAHLETEILFVDEVLAVGDASFQKKCLGKMNEVSKQGRTIVLVSHNMAAIKSLCDRALLIKGGSTSGIGATSEVVDDYLLGSSVGANKAEWVPGSLPGNESIRLSYVRVLPPDEQTVITIDSGACIEIGFDNRKAGINLDCTIYVTASDGVVVFESGHLISTNSDARSGFYNVAGMLPAHFLNAGRYSVDVLFGQDQRYPLFRLDRAVSFEVENTTTGRGANTSVAPGIVRPLLAWRHSFGQPCSMSANVVTRP